MSRKKIVALIMGALLAIGIIGGSLAYFRSTDSVQNRFATTGDETNPGPDLKIVENFEEEKAKSVEPGTNIVKHVQVANVDKYKELIRVRFEVKLLDKDGNVVNELNTYKYDNTDKTGAKVKTPTKITTNDLKGKLKPIFVGDNDDPDKAANEGKIIHKLDTGASLAGKKWYNSDATNTLDSEYYYLGYVNPKLNPNTGNTQPHYTEDLLKSVQLSKDAGIEYKGINYVIEVIAEGVQASNDAFSEVFSHSADEKETIKITNPELYTVLHAAQDVDGSVDIKTGVVPES